MRASALVLLLSALAAEGAPRRRVDARDVRISRDARAGVYSSSALTNQSFLTRVLRTPAATVASGSFTPTTGSLSSFARSSARLCKNSSGTWTSLSTNQPCETSYGPESIQGFTNFVLRSDALDNAAWTAAAGVVVTPDQGTYLATGASLDLVNTTGAGDFISGVSQTTQAYTTTPGPNVIAAFFAAPSSTAVGWLEADCAVTATACVCGRDDGGTCAITNSSGKCVATGTFTTTPGRMWVTPTCSATATTTVVRIGAGTYGSSTGSIIAGGVNFYRSSFAPGAPIVTAGTTVAVSADIWTMTNPLALGDTNFCFRSRVERSAFPGQNGFRYLMQMGTNAAANSASMQLSSGGRIRCELRDASNGVEYYESMATAIGADAVGECCWSAGTGGDGTVSIYINGIKQGKTTTTHTGTGLLGSMPSTFILGAGNTAGATSLLGSLRDFRVCKATRCR